MSRKKSDRVPPATFKDGYPENLPAASMDALEWLLFYRRFYPPSGDEKGRLDRTISRLEDELRPCLPEVDLDCKCRRCASFASGVGPDFPEASP